MRFESFLRSAFTLLLMVTSVSTLPARSGAASTRSALVDAIARARALLSEAKAGKADRLLTPLLMHLPIVADGDDSVRVDAEALWLEARISDQLPFDSTFRARSRAALAWRERHLPHDRARRVASMKSAAKLIAIADSAFVGEAILEDALRLVRREPSLPAPIEVGVRHYYGQLAIGRGDYAAAAIRLRVALTLARDSSSVPAPLANRVATDLALALRNNGDLVEARVVYDSLVSISRRATSAEDRLRGTVHNLSGLAQVLGGLNDPIGQRAVLEDILHQIDGQLGPDDPFSLLTWHRYAQNLRWLGEYDTALAIARRVAERRRVLFGPEYTEYASTLGLQAALLCDRSRFEEAEPLLREAYRILRTHRGAEDPDALGRLINLGNLARARGDDVAAESLFTELVAGRRNRLGPSHGSVAEALYNLALAKSWRGDVAGAVDLGLEAADIRIQLWSATIPFLEERSAIQLVDEYWIGHDIAIDALVRARTPDSAAVSRTWDRVSQLRTLVLDEIARRRIEVAERSRGSDSTTWTAWESARRQIATLATRGYDARKDPSATMLRTSLRAAADSLERVLVTQGATRRSSSFRSAEAEASIRAQLPPDAALVGFVRYPRIKRAQPLDRWYKDLADRYAAFVCKGASGTLALIDIGSADAIDSLIDGWSLALRRTGPREPAAMREYVRRGGALRRAVWDVLLPHLGPARRVFLVSDATLHRVVWEALPLADGRFLVEGDRQVIRLFSERDLALLDATGGQGGLLACGGMLYDAPPAQLNSLVAGGVLRNARPSCDQFASTLFSSLPATLDEVEVVERLWRERRGRGPTVLTREKASAERLIATVPGHGFVHVATHGFLVEDSCVSTGSRREGFKHDPLLRCGLAMSGANQRHSASPGDDDGILLGAEVAQLDLRQCECVVLSACESGLGDFSRTQGVFGLPRAFRIAGAHGVVASLWPVDDEMARAWMEAFYRARLSPRGSSSGSARAADLALLARLRRTGVLPAPRLWAGFVSLGDPR